MSMMETKWFDLPRVESTAKRLPDSTLSNDITVVNLDYGINLYKNAISKQNCVNVINSIEAAISEGPEPIMWSNALVNDSKDDGAAEIAWT